MVYGIALQIATYAFSLFVVPFVSVLGFWILKRWIYDN